MCVDVCASSTSQTMGREGPLAALAGGAPAYAARFCAWSGASGRRYVATVFAALDTVDAADFDACVLIAVGGGSARRVLAVSAIERRDDWRRAVIAGRAAGADEWHVHMLAADRDMRNRAVADLRRRHCPSLDVALCA